jgi:hypothetical protein
MPVNSYNSIKNLLGRNDLAIVEIISIDAGAGTSLVEDLMGGRWNVIGTSVTVGDKAFVYNGNIQGTAPNLTITTDSFV